MTDVMPVVSIRLRMPPAQRIATINETALLAVEIRNTGDDPALLFFGQFGEHWQGKDFFRGAFGFGEIAFAVSEVHKTGLQVQRDGIVDFGPDLARRKEL